MLKGEHEDLGNRSQIVGLFFKKKIVPVNILFSPRKSYDVMRGEWWQLLWKTVKIFPCFSASATSSSASLEDVVNGFSTTTCFPFSSASLQYEKCVALLVVIITRDISLDSAEA